MMLVREKSDGIDVQEETTSGRLSRNLPLRLKGCNLNEPAVGQELFAPPAVDIQEDRRKAGEVGDYGASG